MLVLCRISLNLLSLEGEPPEGLGIFALGLVNKISLEHFVTLNCKICVNE